MNKHLRIKFVGRKSGVEPLKSLTDGNRLIELPENQSRAFSHPDARAILQHAPHLYRRVIKKGQSR